MNWPVCHLPSSGSTDMCHQAQFFVVPWLEPRAFCTLGKQCTSRTIIHLHPLLYLMEGAGELVRSLGKLSMEIVHQLPVWPWGNSPPKFACQALLDDPWN